MLGSLSASSSAYECTFVVRWCREDVSPGIYLVSTGLLLRTTVWHLWRSDSAPAVGAKRCSAATHWSSSARPHDITPVLRQLHWLPVSQRIDFKVAVYRTSVQSLYAFRGLTLPYLSDDRQLVTDVVVVRRHLRSADVYMCAGPRTQSWETIINQSGFLNGLSGEDHCQILPELSVLPNARRWNFLKAVFCHCSPITIFIGLLH